MGSSTNRNLAAKYTRAKSQKIDFVKAEASKAYNYVRTSDADMLTAAIVARPDVVMVQGVAVRKIDTGKTMRQHLRSMF